MGAVRKQKAPLIILKKLSQGEEGPDAVAALLDRYLSPDDPTEAVIEEMSRWFLAMRDSLKQTTSPPPFSVSRLISAFQKAAERRKIDPDQFYAALLERIVLEPGHDEESRALPKHSTKEKILDAALEVFSEKGYHTATVDEIAERAGVGKGTLYRYFANKETLFNELVRLRLEELERSANAVLDGQDDVLTMITKYLRIYFEFFDRNQRLYRLILQERPDVGEKVQDLYVKKVMRRIPLLKRKIYKGSQQGVLKDVDFQTVFHGVMGFIHGVIQKWLACDCSYSLVEELPTVTEVLFYGFVKNPKNANKEE
jgi:AcrR family transcriptional regulator